MVEVDAEGTGENGTEWFTHKVPEVVGAGKAKALYRRHKAQKR